MQKTRMMMPTVQMSHEAVADNGNGGTAPDKHDAAVLVAPAISFDVADDDSVTLRDQVLLILIGLWGLFGYQKPRNIRTAWTLRVEKPRPGHQSLGATPLRRGNLLRV